MNPKFKQPYFLYLVAISFIGLLLLVFGFSLIPSYDSQINFLLLLLLAMSAAVATTSMPISQTAGITYDVGTATSLAAIPGFGPFGAVVVGAASNLSIWLIKPTDQKMWKKSWSQLSFNTGMHVIAIAISSWLFLSVQSLLSSWPLLADSVPWLVTALAYDQINIWLLMGIVRLQHGAEFSVKAFWRDNLWASPINILVNAIGGGLLAFAIAQFDTLGIVIFFLPVFLSAFAFRIYVQRMQTHLAQLEEVVDARTNELRQSNIEKDAFLAVLTHDMKTPLSSIGLYIDLIRHRPNIVEERPDITEVLARSQQSLMEIVNNIVDLEKLQAGQALPLNLETVNLAPFIELSVESMQNLANQKNISLRCDLKSHDLNITADRSQIDRVLTNLISNAVKYTPREGRVMVTGAEMDDYVVITVADNGYGIPEAELPRIFDRFRRVSQHKDKAVGTGLGLAITKALVDAHSGKIEVTSVENEGSTFSVLLPRPRK